FFQAEDGIRDRNVTGVQTCALPICIYFVSNINLDGREIRHEAGKKGGGLTLGPEAGRLHHADGLSAGVPEVLGHRVSSSPAVTEIGRASCRERGRHSGGGGTV